MHSEKLLWAPSESENIQDGTGTNDDNDEKFFSTYQLTHTHTHTHTHTKECVCVCVRTLEREGRDEALPSFFEVKEVKEETQRMHRSVI